MNVHGRAELWQKLADKSNATVVVVGAGINGISVYRELSLQGVDTVLIDKGDYCGGASSAPSRMIHGGLRYLESGEVDLVRESLAERNALLQNAPHFVRPLPTTIPIFTWVSGVWSAFGRLIRMSPAPTRRGALIVKVGLWLYDFYTRRRQVLPQHQFRSKAATHRLWPDLNRSLVCSATYYDAWISYPERLGLEMILDVRKLEPASLALNYVSLVGSEQGILTLRDEITGDQTELRPEIVVNATGAWIDLTNDALADPTAFIGGTKGSHLIIANERLLQATANHMIFYETPDGRVCILFPFMGNVLVGSTDLPVDSPDGVYCTPEEQAYILESLKYVFPDIEIQEDEIVYRFSGIRPLPRSDQSVTAQISRNHQCQLSPATEHRPFPVYSMIGGKWTTFRSFGEQVTNRILDTLAKSPRQSSQDLAIGGGRNYPVGEDNRLALLMQWSGRYKLSLERVTNLFERYGTRAQEVMDYLEESVDQPLKTLPDYSQREIRFLVEQEAVVTLLDLALRRTSLAISGRLNGSTLSELQSLLTHSLQLSVEQHEQMLDQTQAYLGHYHGLTQWQPLATTQSRSNTA